MEAKGFVLADDEFQDAVRYARIKAQCAGMGESYLPLLLPDVIGEKVFRAALNQYTAAVMGAR